MGNKIIVANMKMYMNIDDVEKYLDNFITGISDNIVFCPSSIYIPYFLERKYRVGIQNISLYDNGAYTGEVSVEQVKKMNINYVIVGHSERRKYFHESDYEINKKLLKVLDNDLIGILCIGENLEDKKQFNTNNVLREQMEVCLNNVNKKYEDNIIVAYEPRWSIGTGLIPTIDEINDIVNYIKNFIFDNYRMNVKVIYGGSIDDNNIDLLNRISSLDGFMVGGACINTNKFLKIVNTINSVDK